MVSTQPKRVIVVSDATVGRLVEESLPVLAESEIYQRAGSLVHVVREPEVNQHGTVAASGRPHIRTLPQQLLANELDERIDWQRIERSGGRDQIRTGKPPAEVVRTILEAGEWNHVRPLKGIAHYPILRPDGEIASSDGYDAATAYMLCDLPQISSLDAPTQEDAKKALDRLLELIADFPIADSAGRSAWASVVLTLLARPAVGGPVPCTIFDASMAGSGKTLLASLVSAIVLGEEVTVRAIPGDNSEWHRTLLSIALGGQPYVIFDNARGHVESGALESLITSARFTDRRLRTNEEITADVQTVFALTSNNASVTTDLARRALHCRLTPAEERPELRSGFRFPKLLEHAIQQRAALLASALTVLRGYVTAGRPAVELRPMGSFEAWSSVVRAALVWAGGADPAHTQDALREASAGAETEAGRELLRAWHEQHGSTEITAKELIAGADTSCVGEALDALCDERTPRYVGALLKRMRDRVEGGLRLVGGDATKAGTRWRVLVTGDSDESPGPLALASPL